MTALLIIDHITTDADSASAEVRLADRPVRVSVRFDVPGMIAYDEVPDLIDRHQPARRAVLDRLSRAHQGERIPLPEDLTQVIRDANEPWPLRVDPDVAASERVVVTGVAHDAPDPGLVTVSLEVAGAPAVVVVDHRGGAARPLFRFVAGVHPWQLDRADADGMLLALVTAVRPH